MVLLTIVRDKLVSHNMLSIVSRYALNRLPIKSISEGKMHCLQSETSASWMASVSEDVKMVLLQFAAKLQKISFSISNAESF